MSIWSLLVSSMVTLSVVMTFDFEYFAKIQNYWRKMAFLPKCVNKKVIKLICCKVMLVVF